MHRRFWVLFVAAALMVTSACSDDTDDTVAPASGLGSEVPSTVVPESTVPGDTTPSTEVTAPPPSTEVPVDASGIARDHLRLRYHTTGTTTADLELVVLGNRFGVKTDDGTEKQQLVLDDASTTQCDLAPTPAQCTVSSGADAANTFKTAFSVYLDPLGPSGLFAGGGADLHEVAGRTIAGRASKCMAGTSGEATIEVCADSELGVLTYLQGGGESAELTEITGDVDESALALPEGANVTQSTDPGTGN